MKNLKCQNISYLIFYIIGNYEKFNEIMIINNQQIKDT